MQRLNDLVEKQSKLSCKLAEQIQHLSTQPHQPIGQSTRKKQGQLSKDMTMMLSKRHILKGELREYQKVGVNWLLELHDKKLNGILADEMGLGKTIQTIAMLTSLAHHQGIWGPHLIVVPTSILINWDKEFKKWAPCFQIITYFGNRKERKQKRLGWS